MNTASPRTDAAVIGSLRRPPMANFDGGDVAVVSADFARQLERELSEKVKCYEHNLKVAWQERDQLRAELDKASQRADGMERAGAEQAKRADENYQVIKQLRAEVERLKAELGIARDDLRDEQCEARTTRQQLAQHKADAERLAELHRHSKHSATNPVAGCQPCAAIAAHERLVKEK